MTGGSQLDPAVIPAPRNEPDPLDPGQPRGADRRNSPLRRALRGPRTADRPHEDDGVEPGTAPPDADGDVIGVDGPPPPRLPRHWTWALGATAASCALWLAALAVWNPAHRDGPDLHGYQLSGSPCARRTLAPVIGTSRTSTYTNPAVFSHGPALDRAECVGGALDAADVDGTQFSSLVTVTVALHKKTDPRPEFEDRRGYLMHTLMAADKVTAVHGLGDEAYLLLAEPARLQLKVLHGGAVIEIGLSLDGTISSARDTDGADQALVTIGDPPDLTPYGSRLVTAARTIMAAMKSG
jgi:hypothetical protein